MRQKLFLAVLLAIVVGAGALAGPASAHFIYENEYVYTSGDECTKVRSEISHGSDGIGYERADVLSRGHFLFDCGGTIKKDVNEIKAAVDFYYKSGGNEFVCHFSSWSYNPEYGELHIFAIDFIGETPMCGNGEYRTRAWGYVNQDDGPNWLGGSQYSGSTWHYLPA